MGAFERRVFSTFENTSPSARATLHMTHERSRRVRRHHAGGIQDGRVDVRAAIAHGHDDRWAHRCHEDLADRGRREF